MKGSCKREASQPAKINTNFRIGQRVYFYIAGGRLRGFTLVWPFQLSLIQILHTYFLKGYLPKYSPIFDNLGQKKILKIICSDTFARLKKTKACSNWQTLNRASPLTIMALTSSLLKFSAVSADFSADSQSSFNRWHLARRTNAS